jgi:hypothetical protein
VITADTYSSVLPIAQRKCADATAKLVLAADRRTREEIRGNGRRNRCRQRLAKGVPTPARPANVKKPQVTPPTTKRRRLASRHHRGTRVTPTVHTRQIQRSGLAAFSQVNRLSMVRARKDSNP